MAQVGQASESSVRHSARGNTVQTKLPDNHNKALFPPSALAEQNNALLVAAAQRGVNEAFEVLVRRHQAKILCVAWRFTRNREDAEDITQQTLQKAFVHLRRFQGNSSFSTWLTRIAINEALMWARRKRASHEVSPDALNVNNETAAKLDPTDLAPNPEETCLRLERKRIVATAINKLTPKVRTAIQLQQLGELSIRETAGLMGLSIGTVKARVFHGRSKLRATLKRYVGCGRASRLNHRANHIATDQLVCACD